MIWIILYTIFKVTFRVFTVIGFGPLDENEGTKGISPSFISSLLNIVAVAFLVIGRTINEKG